MDIGELLAYTQENDASDLHLSSGNPPMVRIRGEIRPIEGHPLTADAIRAMVYSIMTAEQRAGYEAEKELDFITRTDVGGRFRVNFFTNSQGPAVVFRSIPGDVPTLEDIGAPPIFRRLAELDRGLVLVTGATGSGKSTTLAAMIGHINQTSRRHILTIEDPIEFVHGPKMSLVNQREVGTDTKSFARALRSALREDPDVILVGEMRDYETVALALTAAETGHLVMGTLHSSSAAKTVDRIIDVFPAGDKPMVRAMLAGSLQAVIAQVLLRRADDTGRVAAYEILIGTPAVRNLIRENKVPQIYSMMQVGGDYGMRTMSDTIKGLIEDGVVNAEEARGLLAVARGEDEEDVDGDPVASRLGPAAPSTTKQGDALRPKREQYSF